VNGCSSSLCFLISDAKSPPSAYSITMYKLLLFTNVSLA
jgi:hypothetical protein